MLGSTKISSCSARLGLGLTLAGLVASGLVAIPPAAAVTFSLALGDVDLPEVRTVRSLAPGVELVTIVRGDDVALGLTPAAAGRGPWRINVLSIDPKVAQGHLRATYGPNLAQVETTTALVSGAAGLAGTNAGYFTFTKDPRYPGDPVGLGLYAGQVMSDPAAVKPEVDFVVNAKTHRVSIGRLTWSGTVKNRSTARRLTLEHLNHPPVVPSACRKLKKQTDCDVSGDVVALDRAFSASTPSGYGAEIVLDKTGCVVRSTRSRGTKLASGQSSLQATGKETGPLIRLARDGCIKRSVTLLDERGKKLALDRHSYGVGGRYRLTKAGKVVIKDAPGAYFDRNPRTFAGTTADAKILLVTIDGRQASSVGTTMVETAGVAQSLGMVESVNLDGGGSTAMSVGPLLVNTPSGGVERAVGDALVYVDGPA